MNKFFTDSNQSIVTSNRILYTASTFAKKSLLYLQEIGELDAKRAHSSRRNCLQSYLFFIVVNGSGSLIYSESECKLSAGDCVFIDCQSSHSHTTDPDKLWSLKWVHFYGPQMPSIYNKYCERGGRPVFTPDDSAPFFSIWDELMRVAGADDYMWDMLINQHLSALLTLIMAESWHPEDVVASKKKASVADVKSYLDSHYGEKITLDGLAERFYINKYYLTKVFKEQYGMPISAYILNVRITKAKQLLRFSKKTVEDIGYEVGIGEPHYFSQVFKSVEGVPPSVYRKQW